MFLELSHLFYRKQLSLPRIPRSKFIHPVRLNKNTTLDTGYRRLCPIIFLGI